MTWETIANLIHDEWMILLLLLLWSVAGVTIICERVYALWNVLPKSEVFKNRVISAIEGGDLPKAHAFCETANDPLATVFGRGLRVFAKTPHKTTEAVMSQRTVAIGTFKRYLWALGTVGSSAPFVGLFGTVVGILKAGHGRLQGRVAGDRGRAGGNGGRLAGRHLRHHRLQLLHLTGGRHRGRVQGVLRGIPVGAG